MKNKLIQVYCNEEEKEKIKALAKQEHLSVSSYIKSTILKKIKEEVFF
jgi:hypothetical protein